MSGSASGRSPRSLTHVGIGSVVACVWLGTAAVTLSSIALETDALFLVAMLTFAAVGAIVTTVRPAHPVGWLLLAQGVFAAIGDVSGPIAKELLADEPYSPVGWLAAWVHPWLWLLGISATWTTFLLFPDGRLPSRRWRPALWLAAAGVVLTVVTGVLTLRVPTAVLVGLSADGNVPGTAGDVADLAYYAVFMMIPVGLVSLVFRYRAAGPTIRQQMKWPFLGAAPWAFGIGILIATGRAPWDAPLIATVLIFAGFFAVPVGIGIGILRHGLFDIDRLIRRTLVYSVVTAILAGGYAVLVVGSQAVVRPLNASSDLAVAASTLAVAAAFGPVRRRVQRGVDRRFNRGRYDATRTVEEFGHRLRDELDLGALVHELRDVAARTVQPVRASVWLRETSP